MWAKKKRKSKSKVKKTNKQTGMTQEKLTKKGGKTGTYIPCGMGDNETQLKHISDQSQRQET